MGINTQLISMKEIFVVVFLENPRTKLENVKKKKKKGNRDDVNPVNVRISCSKNKRTREQEVK